MWPFKKQKADEEFTNIGNVLRKLGSLDEAKLAEAVRAQDAARAAGQPAKLGEILVRMGAITEADLRVALDIQREMRRGRAEGVLRLAERQTEVAQNRVADMRSTLAASKG